MTKLKDLNLSPAIINTIENGVKYLRENVDAINHWIEQSQKDEARAKEIIELLMNGSIENFLDIEPINGMTLLSVIAQVDETSQAKARSMIASNRASNPRPIRNEDGVTLDEVIAKLKKNHPNLYPAEMWPHLKTAIEEWSDSECKEFGNTILDKNCYQFTIKNKNKRISYGTFRKK